MGRLGDESSSASEAVVFDLDGVIVDTEQVWDDVRARLTEDWGGTYTAESQRAMMGMSSTEWSSFMHDELGVPQTPEEINREVVRRMLASYQESLPFVPGSVRAVRRLAQDGVALAVASSSNRSLIDAVLEHAGLQELFLATVSSEEVAHGKPAPDVYLEAAERLGVDPSHCVAVEDSANGIRAAHAAGMNVLVLPNMHYPPGENVLELATVVMGSLDELTPALVRRIRGCVP